MYKIASLRITRFLFCIPIISICVKIDASYVSYSSGSSTTVQAGMPSTAKSSQSLLQSCPNCIVDFNSTDPLDKNEAVCIRTACRHKYHMSCLLPWIRTNHNDCPYCREDLRIYDPITVTGHLVDLKRLPTREETVLINELRSYNRTIAILQESPDRPSIPLPVAVIPQAQAPVDNIGSGLTQEEIDNQRFWYNHFRRQNPNLVDPINMPIPPLPANNAPMNNGTSVVSVHPLSTLNQTAPVTVMVSKPTKSWLPALLGVGFVGIGVALAVKMYSDYRKNQNRISAQ